jgi:hypothetical protein
VRARAPPSGLSATDHVFLVDRDLGAKAVPTALRQAGCAVEVHADHFPGEAPDHAWIKAAGKRGWFVVTHDDRIRYNPLAKQAVLAGKVGVFIVAVKGKDVNGPLLAHTVAAAAPRMRDFIAKNEPPFFAKIHRGGTVTRVDETPARLRTIRRRRPKT